MVLPLRSSQADRRGIHGHRASPKTSCQGKPGPQLEDPCKPFMLPASSLSSPGRLLGVGALTPGSCWGSRDRCELHQPGWGPPGAAEVQASPRQANGTQMPQQVPAHAESGLRPLRGAGGGGVSSGCPQGRKRRSAWIPPSEIRSLGTERPEPYLMGWTGQWAGSEGGPVTLSARPPPQ